MSIIAVTIDVDYDYRGVGHDGVLCGPTTWTSPKPPLCYRLFVNMSVVAKKAGSTS